MKKLLLTLFICSFISSCVASPKQIREGLLLKSQPFGFTEKTYNTKNFKIFSLQKITDNTSPINVYIEGDGQAWRAKRVVSQNPTPKNLMLADIALSDTAPNIIYFARPCQFVEDEKCSKKYWTHDRFSKPVIESYKEILEQFKNRKINFIGYSGGAAVVMLLSSEMKNVQYIKTIAGNLDYKAFTEYHNVDELNDEMNIDAAIKKISAIPQIHYIGGEDKVITDFIFESFKNKIDNFPTNAKHIKFITIPNATHSKGWNLGS